MRKKLFAKSAEALRSDPRKAFNQWEAANIIGFSWAIESDDFCCSAEIYWRHFVRRRLGISCAVETALKPWPSYD